MTLKISTNHAATAMIVSDTVTAMHRPITPCLGSKVTDNKIIKIRPIPSITDLYNGMDCVVSIVVPDILNESETAKMERYGRLSDK